MQQKKEKHIYVLKYIFFLFKSVDLRILKIEFSNKKKLMQHE